MTDSTIQFAHPMANKAAVKILAAVEADLLLWESGRSAPVAETKSASTRKASTQFSRFFRRALLRVPFLESRLDALSEDASEADAATHLERPRRPPLKDLPIDILSIAKLACACVRLEAENGIRVSDTFTRIALRLLVSHNGRLMHDCPIRDLALLCEAASRTSSPALREIVSLFARRVLQYVNGPGADQVSSLSTGDAIALLWSLGELGVKCASSSDDISTAHRRLKLVTRVPLMDVAPVQSLRYVPIQLLLQLVRVQVGRHHCIRLWYSYSPYLFDRRYMLSRR
jgi:hypothetical protein